MKLYSSPPMFGLPNPSPFVVKVMTLCQMAGIDYETAQMSFEEAPKGKMPYISTNEGLLGDSTFIRFYFESLGHDFDAGYDTSDLAIGWVVEKLLEEHLYWAMVHTRWQVDNNFNKGPRHFFDMVPEAARETVMADVRAKLKNNLYAQGMGRHSRDEIARLAIKDVEAVKAILGDKKFILGDRPCGYDASVHAFVWAMACPLFESEIGAYIRADATLMAYIERMNALYYTDYIKL